MLNLLLLKKPCWKMIKHILLALSLVGSASAGIVPDGKPCIEFQTAQPMQGLTVNGNTLYAIVNFRVYSLPLSTENILSGGRFALFNMTDEGLWSDVPWLKILKQKIMKSFGGWETLLQLNLIPAKNGQNPDSFAKLIHAIYKKSPEEQESFTFELLSENDTKELNEHGDKTLTKRFAFFSDGAGQGYIVRKESGGQVPAFRLGPFAKSDNGGSVSYPVLHTVDYPSYLAIISKPGFLTMSSFSSFDSFQNHSHLVSEPENAFGFLFNGTFHYWDLNKRQVVLFQDPLSVGNHTVRFKTVPMSKYFVCSDKQWSTAAITSDDYDIAYTATSETSTLIAWIIIAILIVAIFILLFTCALCKVCGKEKRTLNINRQGSRSPRSRLFLKSLSRVPSSKNSIPPSLSVSSLPLTSSSSAVSNNGIRLQQMDLKSGKVKSWPRGQMAVSTTPSTTATSAFGVEDLRRLNLEAPRTYKIVQQRQKNTYNVDFKNSSTLPSHAPSWSTSEVLKAPSSVDGDFKTASKTCQTKSITKNKK